MTCSWFTILILKKICVQFGNCVKILLFNWYIYAIFMNECGYKLFKISNECWPKQEININQIIHSRYENLTKVDGHVGHLPSFVCLHVYSSLSWHTRKRKWSEIPRIPKKKKKEQTVYVSSRMTDKFRNSPLSR